MSDINPKKVGIDIGGKHFEMSLNLLVIDKLQDHFKKPLTETIDMMLSDGPESYKILTYMIYVMCNDYIDECNEESKERIENVAYNWIARRINGTSKDLIKAIIDVLSVSFPDKKDDGQIEETP